MRSLLLPDYPLLPSDTSSPEPGNVTFAETGVLSGTPQKAGMYRIGVTATDGNSQAWRFGLSLVITPALQGVQGEKGDTGATGATGACGCARTAGQTRHLPEFSYCDCGEQHDFGGD
jgi:hypothetical protein